MDDKLNEYISSFNEETKKKIMSNIIISSNSNNNQQFLYSLNQAFQFPLSFYNFEEIELFSIATVKFLERNFEKIDILPFFYSLCKMLKFLKLRLKNKIQFNWKLFYKIFEIYSNEQDDRFFNSILIIRPFIKNSVTENDYKIIKNQFLRVLLHYKKISDLKTAFKCLFTFAPNSFIQIDEDLQLKLHLFQTNQLELFDYSTAFFYKVAKGKDKAFQFSVIEYQALLYMRIIQYMKGDIITLDTSYNKVQHKIEKQCARTLFDFSIEKFKNDKINHHVFLINYIITKLWDKNHKEKNIEEFINNLFYYIYETVFTKPVYNGKNKKVLSPNSKKEVLILSKELYYQLLHNLFIIPNNEKVVKAIQSLMLIFRESPIEAEIENFFSLMIDKINKADKTDEDVNNISNGIKGLFPFLFYERNCYEKANKIDKVYTMIQTIFTFLDTIHYEEDNIDLLIEMNKWIVSKFPMLIMKLLNNKIDEIDKNKRRDEYLIGLNVAITNSQIKKEEIASGMYNYVEQKINKNPNIQFNQIEYYLIFFTEKEKEKIMHLSINNIIEYDKSKNKPQLERYFFLQKENLNGIVLKDTCKRNKIYFQLIKYFLNEPLGLKYSKEIFDIMFLLINQKENEIYHKLFFELFDSLLSLLNLKRGNEDSEEKCVYKYPSKDLLKVCLDLYSTFYSTYERYIFATSTNDDKTITNLYTNFVKCYSQFRYNIFLFLEEEKLYSLIEDTELFELYKTFNKVITSIIEQAHKYIKTGRKYKDQMFSALFGYINFYSQCTKDIKNIKSLQRYKEESKYFKYDYRKANKIKEMYMKDKKYHSIIISLSMNLPINELQFGTFMFYCYFPRFFPKEENNETFKYIIYQLKKQNKIQKVYESMFLQYERVVNEIKMANDKKTKTIEVNDDITPKLLIHFIDSFNLSKLMTKMRLYIHTVKQDKNLLTIFIKSMIKVFRLISENAFDLNQKRIKKMQGNIDEINTKIIITQYSGNEQYNKLIESEKNNIIEQQSNQNDINQFLNKEILSLLNTKDIKFDIEQKSILSLLTVLYVILRNIDLNIKESCDTYIRFMNYIYSLLSEKNNKNRNILLLLYYIMMKKLYKHFTKFIIEEATENTVRTNRKSNKWLFNSISFDYVISQYEPNELVSYIPFEIGFINTCYKECKTMPIDIEFPEIYNELQNKYKETDSFFSKQVSIKYIYFIYHLLQIKQYREKDCKAVLEKILSNNDTLNLYNEIEIYFAFALYFTNHLQSTSIITNELNNVFTKCKESPELLSSFINSFIQLFNLSEIELFFFTNKTSSQIYDTLLQCDMYKSLYSKFSHNIRYFKIQEHTKLFYNKLNIELFDFICILNGDKFYIPEQFKYDMNNEYNIAISHYLVELDKSLDILLPNLLENQIDFFYKYPVSMVEVLQLFYHYTKTEYKDYCHYLYRNKGCMHFKAFFEKVAAFIQPPGLTKEVKMKNIDLAFDVLEHNMQVTVLIAMETIKYEQMLQILLDLFKYVEYDEELVKYLIKRSTMLFDNIPIQENEMIIDCFFGEGDKYYSIYQEYTDEWIYLLLVEVKRYKKVNTTNYYSNYEKLIKQLVRIGEFSGKRKEIIMKYFGFINQELYELMNIERYIFNREVRKAITKYYIFTSITDNLKSKNALT